MVRWMLLLLSLAVCCGAGCSSWRGGKVDASQLASADARAQWWKANKHQAEFVPGKGFRVAGVEGFYDAQGQPMEGPMRAAGPVAVADTPSKGVLSNSWLENLDPAISAKKIKSAFAAPVDQSVAKQKYEEAYQLFQQKKYKQAAPLFAEAAKRAPESLVGDNALFMVAESYYFGDKYPQANDAYATLLKQYPNSRHLDRAMVRQFSIANYWLKHHYAEPHWSITWNMLDGTRPRFDTHGHALRTFQNIRLNDPTGPLADDALMATANAYFVLGRYDDADYHYDLLRREYPESEHQYQAHVLGMQCKLRKYQGPDYDGTPLVEADELAEQLLKQFPGEVRDNRERIIESRQKIAREKALREYALAQYYDHRRSYGAAKYYYAQLAEEYPGTELAEASRERIAALQDEPDVPEQTAQWLVNLFPDGKKDIAIAAQPAEEGTAQR